MVDKNSQNSNVPQKQPRKSHYVINVKTAAKYAWAVDLELENWR